MGLTDSKTYPVLDFLCFCRGLVVVLFSEYGVYRVVPLLVATHWKRNGGDYQV